MHFIFLKSGLNIHWILHFESWFVLFLSLTLNSAIEMSFPPQSLNLIGCCEHRKFSTFSAFDENLLWLATAISHYYLLNFCSKLWLANVISHYYLLNFSSKLWLANAISHYYLLNLSSKLWLANAISHYYLLSFRSKFHVRNWMSERNITIQDLKWQNPWIS